LEKELNVIDQYPPIEITIEPVALRTWAIAALISIGVLIGLIGVAASPLVDWHPVVLTRERLVIKDYLSAADAWLPRLDEVVNRLEGLTPTTSAAMTTTLDSTAESVPISPVLVPATTLPSHIDLSPETPLPVFQSPASQPGNLYDQAQQAEQVMRDLQAIDAEMQRIEVPSTLVGLQDIASTTLQDVALWSSTVLTAIGAPSPGNLAVIEPAHQTALATLMTLHRSIETQHEQVR
jgi:hypothetical protein